MRAITDAQAHIWAEDTPQRPWPEGGRARAHRPTPLGVEELLGLMDAAGVARTVLVPPSFEGDRNDVVLDAAERHPERFAVMGRVPLQDPRGEAILRDLRGSTGVRGLRLVFNWGRHVQWLRDGTADWIWRAADELGLPVMVFPPGQLDAIDAVARRHPGLRLIVDHLGMGTELRDAQVDAAIEELLPLSDRANVAVKASALPCYVSEPFPFPSLPPRVRRVVDAFGRERVFWGSDVSRLPCAYDEAVRLFTEHLDWASPEDVEWLMGRGLSQWLQWPIAVSGVST